MPSHQALIDELLSGLGALRRAVADLTPEQWTARPVAGRWSTLEVVCHLVDSEQAWCHRMKRVIAEDRPLLIGYDETRFTAALGYHDRDSAEELELLERQRRQMAAVLGRLPETAWSRQGVHSERGLVTLAEMVRLESEHVFHHLRHVQDKRRALGLPVEG
jgi:uncharacterized damage-inducible protein DinB